MYEILVFYHRRFPWVFLVPFQWSCLHKAKVNPLESSVWYSYFYKLTKVAQIIFNFAVSALALQQNVTQAA